MRWRIGHEGYRCCTNLICKQAGLRADTHTHTQPLLGSIIILVSINIRFFFFHPAAPSALFLGHLLYSATDWDSPAELHSQFSGEKTHTHTRSPDGLSQTQEKHDTNTAGMHWIRHSIFTDNVGKSDRDVVHTAVVLKYDVKTETVALSQAGNKTEYGLH